MKKSKATGILVLILAIMAGMSWYAGTIISTVGVGENRNIKLGLDLAGGVSITYQAVEDNPSAEDMKDTVYKLQKRVETYSTESSVYQEGNNRINIEIPGVSDANAILEELGKPGSLEFQNEAGETLVTGTDIKNAQAGTYNDQMGNRQYVVELTLTDEGAEKFAKATSDNVGKTMPIVYDGQTISAPGVDEAITGGKAQIDNMESFEAAEELASTIRIGSLSLELEAPFQGSRRPVRGRSNCHQLKSGIDRPDTGNGIYGCHVPCARVYSQPCPCALFCTDGVGALDFRYHTDPSGHCRDYPVHRYGGGCQRHYFCPYP